MSSSDSSRVVTGSRSGKERRGAPLVAILAPVGKGGAGRGGVGLIFDLAGEPRPRLRREGWGLHAGRLGTLKMTGRKTGKIRHFCYELYSCKDGLSCCCC